VHEEACRWEHVMSEQVEHKILDILGHPTETPYGTPIPRIEDEGVGLHRVFLDGVRSTVDATQDGERVTATIRRLGEPVQFEPELLAQLRQAGIFPGSTGAFWRTGPYVAMQIDGYAEAIELPSEVASHIFVAA
jgi:DtxR family Mn-dependent transcriptional regulator